MFFYVVLSHVFFFSKSHFSNGFRCSNGKVGACYMVRRICTSAIEWWRERISKRIDWRATISREFEILFFFVHFLTFFFFEKISRMVLHRECWERWLPKIIKNLLQTDNKMLKCVVLIVLILFSWSSFVLFEQTRKFRILFSFVFIRITCVNFNFHFYSMFNVGMVVVLVDIGRASRSSCQHSAGAECCVAVHFGTRRALAMRSQRCSTLQTPHWHVFDVASTARRRLAHSTTRLWFVGICRSCCCCCVVVLFAVWRVSLVFFRLFLIGERRWREETACTRAFASVFWCVLWRGIATRVARCRRTCHRCSCSKQIRCISSLFVGELIYNWCFVSICCQKKFFFLNLMFFCLVFFASHFVSIERLLFVVLLLMNHGNRLNWMLNWSCQKESSI